MSLSHTYAAVITNAESMKLGKPFADKLVQYMKAKGHLSLLPQIVRLIARMPKKGTAVVAVAKKGDAEKYKNGISAALNALDISGTHRTVEDPRIVGGYMVRTGSGVVDRSFRSALVSLYRSIARS